MTSMKNLKILVILKSNILGGIEVVANEYSKRATETVVSLGDKMRHLGTAGNEKRISQIKATATNFKRLIGLLWGHRRPIDVLGNIYSSI